MHSNIKFRIVHGASVLGLSKRRALESGLVNDQVEGKYANNLIIERVHGSSERITQGLSH